MQTSNKATLCCTKLYRYGFAFPKHDETTISLRDTSLSFVNNPSIFNMKVSLLTALSAVSLSRLPSFSVAAPASPHPANYSQPDGSKTPELFLRGDEHYAWLSDSNGYTIIKDSKGWFVYARKNDGGNLEPMEQARVGRVDDVESLGLQPNLLHDHAFDNNSDDDDEQELLRLRQRRKLAGKPKAILCEHEATAMDPCYLKQLALLVRFADHETRKLPSPEDINVLFNNNGPTGTNVAATGSIADVYRANSFDTFVLDTHVSPWIQISKTEEYCSGGKNGFNLEVTRECWSEALKMYAETLGENGLSMFDGDADGHMDGMVIVHSGAAAELNGEDCETGSVFNNRIWSHSVKNFELTSEFGLDIGVKTGRFYVFSAVHGVCPEYGVGSPWVPGRIATGVHEGGHFLGLKDLYGKAGSSRGIGNWGFMGNMYGWDSSGNYPGLMSGYSRHLLGWVDVIDITYSQTISVTSSCDSDQIFRITHRMGSDEIGEEYLLIENRQPCGHDVKLQYDKKDRQGIVIFRVDHTALGGQNDGSDIISFDTDRAPTDPEWPMVHARVSVLQGDGLHDLENNENRGDHTDSFRVQGGATKIAKMISNEGVTMNNGDVKQYPNTKSIAYGEERETGISIEILDKPQNVMRVKITLLDEDGVSIDAPSPGLEARAEETGPSTGGQQGSDGEGSGQSGSSESSSQAQADSVVKTESVGANESSTPSDTSSGENSDANSITQVGGSTSSIFNRFSYTGDSPGGNDPTQAAVASPTDAPVAAPTTDAPVASLTDAPLASPSDAPVALATDAPVASPTDAPVASPTDAPVALAADAPVVSSTDAPVASPVDATTAVPEESESGGEYSCDNSKFEEFQFTGIGQNPTKYTVKQCQFIKPDKRDPIEFCNTADLWNDNQPVYMKCQRECNVITGCPPPDPDERRQHLRH